MCSELPVFGAVYRLTLRVFTLAQGLSREFRQRYRSREQNCGNPYGRERALGAGHRSAP